ncbi:MAG: hypothetical protein M0R70_09735 [Nitrospirae bacterium]|nr:hypothetical protein [Nitrospirota bacterium]
MKNSVLRSALPALLLSALVLIPFFNKAFTIDDPVFLFEARHALVDPLHPTAFEMTWDEKPERVSQLVPTGPVMAWLLIPTVLADGAEWLAHATQLAMLWFAIIATVSLAQRFGLPKPWPTASGLILVAMPAVLGMAGTAMPDVPAMAFGIAGIERLIAWSQNRRYSQALLTALFLGIAPLTRTHQILLLGVGGILLLGPTFSLAALRNRWSAFLPLVAALLITLAVNFITSDPHPGAGNLAGAAIRYSSVSISQFARNAVALPIHWVLAMAFALPWTALRWRTMLRNRLVLGAAAAGVLLSAMALAYTTYLSLPLSIIAGLGIAVLWDLFADGWSRRDSIQLALGLWLLIALPAVFYANLPPKYMVVSAPAAALLIARELSSRKGKESWLILGVTVVLGICLGVAILRADATFANLGRQAAAELIAPNVAAGKRVWFVGHWGYQWYAENAGARPATLTPPYPSPGDLIVVSIASALSIRVLEEINDQFPNMTQIARIEDSRLGGRLMNKRIGAGFYSNISGYWPWVWSDSLVDQYTVWRIE